MYKPATYLSFFSNVYKHIVVLIFFAYSYALNAEQIRFEHLNKNSGLPGNTINCIALDSSGFMWFGTKTGLARYDGYDFKNFIYNEKDSTSLSDNFVRCLYVSKKGTLYIGTIYNGFCIYNPQTETFKRFRHSPSGNSIGNNQVTTITEDSKGYIWIATREGFDKFDPVTGKFEHYDMPVPRGKELNGPNLVSSIFIDKNDHIWIYSLGNKISKFNPLTKTFEFIKFSEHTMDGQLLNRGGVIFKDAKQNIWIGTEFEGLYKYSLLSNQFTHYTKANGKLASDLILDVKEDKEGSIWVATDGGGLARYNPGNDDFELFRYDVTNIHSISTNAIYCIYESQPGVLWIGTYGGGINIYKKYKEKFRTYSNKGESGYCLSYKSVLGFEESPDGKVWVGTDGGGLNLFDPETNTFRHLPVYNKDDNFNIPKTLYLDKKNNLWLGSFGKGLCVIEPDGKKQFYSPQVNPDEHHIQNASIWAIEEDKYSNVWIGLLGNGIDVFNPVDKTFKHIYGGGKEGLIEGSIHVLFKDSKGRMWVGGETGGLALYDDKHSTFIKFTAHNSKGLLTDKVKIIFEDSRQNLWIGYEYGGLCLLIDEEQKKFKTYTIANGLPSSSVFGLLEDNNQNLWISTDNGLSVFNPLKNTFRNFDVSDGLLSNEFMYGAVLKDKAGNMYFGGTEGMITFNPDKLWYNTTPPKVYITSIQIFNNKLKSANAVSHKIYSPAVNTKNELVLQPEEYIVKFEFSALDYISPSKNQYAYMLEGFDKDWTYTTSLKRFATYTSLPPGTYTFRVKASNNDGVWNQQGAVLFITVLPPWWETIWFRMLVVLLVSLIVVLIIYFRINLERTRRKKLQELVMERTVELNEAVEELKKVNQFKDKLFSIVSHDLKGPAGSIKKLAQMLELNFKTLPEKDKIDFITHILKSSDAQVNLINNLLTWARVQTGNIVISNSEIDIGGIVQRVTGLLELPAREKNITLVVEIKDNVQLVADENMIETVIRNIVNNAIKFTPSGGKIHIVKETTDDTIFIKVKDTGIGIKPEVLESLFSKNLSTKGTSGETGTGLGLIICKEFTEANGGKLKVISSPEEGTEFILCFKVLSKMTENLYRKNF